MDTSPESCFSSDAFNSWANNVEYNILMGNDIENIPDFHGAINVETGEWVNTNGR